MPTPVKVGVCDSVMWKNTHTQAHTSTGNGAQTWTTGSPSPRFGTPLWAYAR